MYLSQELTSKDQQLKTQKAVSLQDEDLKNTEKIWLKSGFFKDCQSDLTISKANFPENTSCYINQGQLSLVKGGEQAIYLELTVCGQMKIKRKCLFLNCFFISLLLWIERKNFCYGKVTCTCIRLM